MINLIVGIGNLAIRVIDLYQVILLVYFLMSWLPGAYESRLGQILYRICEPYVGFFRRFVPPIGMISLAGVVALAALQFIRYGVVAVIDFIVRLLI